MRFFSWDDCGVLRSALDAPALTADMTGIYFFIA